MVSGERALKRWIGTVRNGHEPPFARLDTHRRLRRGVPEVVFCEGKTLGQLTKIVRHLERSGELILLTRLSPQAFSELKEPFPTLRYNPVARLAYQLPIAHRTLNGFVLVVTGGTADLPVAEEAAGTLELLGSRVVRLYDVGIAGLHRLFSEWRLLRRAAVIVAVAGMDGALPGVVAGLVRCPVIAVPTSIGYGAGFHGIAPLLTMLNSCAPGIGVVNIDNGFGGAYLAHAIHRTARIRP